MAPFFIGFDFGKGCNEQGGLIRWAYTRFSLGEVFAGCSPVFYCGFKSRYAMN
jgi:hypothetical protein